MPSVPLESFKALLGKQWPIILATFVITVSLMKGQAHIEGRFDELHRTLAELGAKTWTVDMMELRDSWVAAHNPSNAIPITTDIIRESRKSNPSMRSIGRFAAP